MRVIAARFEDARAASVALRRLSRAFGLRPEDASVAPLQGDGGTVLAGRFLDERLEEARALIRQHGGVVMTEVDEALTRPRRRITGQGVGALLVAAGFAELLTHAARNA